MTSFLLAGPAEEPVALAQAKAFLRVEDGAEDGLIETLITAARLHIESVTGRILMAQEWRAVRDGWPADRVIRLAHTPLIALDAIRVYDEAGTPTLLDLDEVLPDAQAVPARIILPARVAGMPRPRPALGIEIDYTAGFGAAPEDVPADLRQALLTLLGYWFEHRDAVAAAGAGAVIPPGFERLVAPYRRVRL